MIKVFLTAFLFIKLFEVSTPVSTNCKPIEEAGKNDPFQWVPNEKWVLVCTSKADINKFSIQTRAYFPEKEIKYYFYENPNIEPTEISFPVNLDQNLLLKYREIVLLVHGWQSDYKSEVIDNLARTYLHKNLRKIIIGIDWSGGAKNLIYPISRNRVEDTAKAIAEHIAEIPDRDRINITCIGHSLGAHICGAIGKLVNLDLLVGLDPAGPLFYRTSPDLLNKTDAKYVKVIHTNAGYLGFKSALGHSDIYPFGGTSQPGCLSISIICSHSKAVDYFIDAVQDNGLELAECPSIDDLKQDQCIQTIPLKLNGAKIRQKFGIFTTKRVIEGKGTATIPNIFLVLFLLHYCLMYTRIYCN